MSEENAFLTSDNNVFIEISSNTKENYFNNLLNPDRRVNKYIIIFIQFKI